MYARKMRVEFDSVLFRSPDPERAAAFWADVLGRTTVEDGEEWHIVAAVGQIGLRFGYGGTHGDMPNRLHLHLSQTRRDQRRTIATCVDAGGRLQGNGHVPPGGFAVMADPVGVEFELRTVFAG